MIQVTQLREIFLMIYDKLEKYEKSFPENSEELKVTMKRTEEIHTENFIKEINPNRQKYGKNDDVKTTIENSITTDINTPTSITTSNSVLGCSSCDENKTTDSTTRAAKIFKESTLYEPTRETDLEETTLTITLPATKSLKNYRNLERQQKCLPYKNACIEIPQSPLDEAVFYDIVQKIFQSYYNKNNINENKKNKQESNIGVATN